MEGAALASASCDCRGGSIRSDRANDAVLASLPGAPVLLVIGGGGSEPDSAPAGGWRVVQVPPNNKGSANRDAIGRSFRASADGRCEKTALLIERASHRIGVGSGIARLLARRLRDAGVLAGASLGVHRSLSVDDVVLRFERLIEKENAWAVAIGPGAMQADALAAARAARRVGVPFAALGDPDLGPVAAGERMRRRLMTRRDIGEVYGADAVLDAYGLASPLPGFWMHGWTPEWLMVDPLFVAQHKRMVWTPLGRRVNRDVGGLDLAAPQWVATDRQRDYLVEHGYSRVHAIGLPIVYDEAAAPVDVVRDEGLLLAMPPHNHAGRGGDDPVARGFAESVADEARAFGRVLLCVSADDYAARRWWPAFARVGIGVVIGSSSVERDSLRRMRTLLGIAGTVVTNGFGSHIAYAAYCGARVCVRGPWADMPTSAIRGAHRCLLRPALVEAQRRMLGEEALRREEGWLFVKPSQASRARAWGEREVGVAFRRTPDAICQLAEEFAA